MVCDDNNLSIEDSTTIDATWFAKYFFETTRRDKILRLRMFVDSDDEELKELYKVAAETHNNKLMTNPDFYDSGFDLKLPKREDDCDEDADIVKFYKETIFVPKHVNKIDFKVKCCAEVYQYAHVSGIVHNYYSPFYTYMRSSMSKTPLRLANNQGIIDAGYRGNLIGMFDCIVSNDDIIRTKGCDFCMDKYSRVLQICGPNMEPIYVEIVNSIEELGPSTVRGEGGFGSTGV